MLRVEYSRFDRGAGDFVVIYGGTVSNQTGLFSTKEVIAARIMIPVRTRWVEAAHKKFPECVAARRSPVIVNCFLDGSVAPGTLT